MAIAPGKPTSWRKCRSRRRPFSAGCRFLDLDVVNLRQELPAFYLALGFAPYGTSSFADPDKLRREAHLVLMTKPLVGLWTAAG